MNGYASMILSLIFGMPMDQEKFDKMFDEVFIKYFRDNPNGYDEVIKEVERMPEDIKEGIRERLKKLYEQTKEGVEKMKHPRYKVGDNLKTPDGYTVEVLHVDGENYKLSSVIGLPYVSHSIGFVDKMYKLIEKGGSNEH
jgi:hypothetical protein